MYMYRPHTFFDVATSKFPGTRLKVKNLTSYPQVLRNNLNFLRPKISLFFKKGCKNKNSESFDWFYGTRKIFLEKKNTFSYKIYSHMHQQCIHFRQIEKWTLSTIPFKVKHPVYNIRM